MKRYMAEFVGAFFLIFIGAGSVIAEVQRSKILLTDSFGTLGIALAHGLALAMAIAAIGRISGGHANPAVTIAFWVARRISPADLLGYIVFQILGGIAAAFALKGLMPSDAFEFAGGGTPSLAAGIPVLKGALIEVVMTFFLVFVIWGVAVDKKGPKALAPIAIGLTLTFSQIFGLTFTGAGLNPARWIGPALASGSFDGWPVYIAGPILGALLGALFYETVFLDDDDADEMVDIEDDDEEVVSGRTWEAVGAAQARERDFRDTPSPMTPPSPAPPAAGPDSPMVPPAPVPPMPAAPPVTGPTRAPAPPPPPTTSTPPSSSTPGGTNGPDTNRDSDEGPSTPLGGGSGGPS